MERRPEQKLLLYAMAYICMRWHAHIRDGLYMYAIFFEVYTTIKAHMRTARYKYNNYVKKIRSEGGRNVCDGMVRATWHHARGAAFRDRPLRMRG